jgi:biotin synthase
MDVRRIELPPPRRAEESAAAAFGLAEAERLFALPLFDLVERAHAVHREHFPAGDVERATLLSIKTGGCPEDCAYCPQAARYDTGVADQALLALDEVTAAARAARAAGATRFCMGAAWRGPKQRDLEPVLDMVRAVKALGLQTCATLGLLREGQAEQLKAAGLDYYNHNIDTGPEYYGKVITTRTLQDRLDTLENVREAGMAVCCGGIIGMGEAREDRIGMLVTLANLPTPPESVPINALMKIKGTPLGDSAPIDNFEFVRTIAAARIMMPASVVRLSAGRENMSEELQSLCFLAGANSIFIGPKLLTTKNPAKEKDDALWAKLGVRSMDV